MKLDADTIACAALVEKADPHRFRAAMAAPVEARNVLFPLYAMNVEVSRAPWVTQEAMIAEMRLQWWRDVADEIGQGGPVRRHEVATPLARVIAPDLAPAMDALVAQRRWDIYRDPFEDEAHFDAYLDATGAGLMWLAARALGATDESTVRDYGYAAGLAAWLLAVPELEARGRVPLLDGRAEAVAALAQNGLLRLRRARSRRRTVSSAARAALLPGWQAEAVLKQAARDPIRVANGTLAQSQARSALTLAWQSSSGRF